MASEEIGKPPEWVVQKQRALQGVHKLIHLKGPRDKIVSVIVPGALAATGLALIGRGVYHLATGKGVIEWAYVRGSLIDGGFQHHGVAVYVTMLLIRTVYMCECGTVFRVASGLWTDTKLY
jgi:hypothetical protein